MKFKQYRIAKLSTQDEKTVYVGIIKHLDNNTSRVRVLKQPIYEISTQVYSDQLFKQYCHEDDEVQYLKMMYISSTMSIVVHENMLQEVSHNEIVDLLKYFNHISFGESARNKSNENIKREKMIISEALECLYINNWEAL